MLFRSQRAGNLLRDLGDLATEVSEVQFEESGDLRVGLRGAGEVLRMGNPPYRKKLLTFLGLRADLAQRCPRAEYFDLRFRDRIYAKPAEGEPFKVASAGTPGKDTTSDTAATSGRGR